MCITSILLLLIIGIIRVLKIFRRSISRHEKLENGECKSYLNQKSLKKTEKKSKKSALKKRLPLWVNAAILLLFCMLGGVVYVAACLYFFF